MLKQYIASQVRLIDFCRQIFKLRTFLPGAKVGLLDFISHQRNRKAFVYGSEFVVAAIPHVPASIAYLFAITNNSSHTSKRQRLCQVLEIVDQ